MATKSSSIIHPEAIRHSFRLSDGRCFSYYTFEPTAESSAASEEYDDDTETLHPVLYLHGFPGQGMELASLYCARQMMDLKCQLFAPDRPGVGYSDQISKTSEEPDDRLEAVIDDLWEFIVHMGWTEFSVIGYSGGGPYALKLLSSYIKKKTTTTREKNGTDAIIPKLDSMAIVAGLCCSAGVEGMMPEVKQFVRLSSTHNTSCASTPMIDIIFMTVLFMLYVFPIWFMEKFVPYDFPAIDKEVVTNHDVMGFMVESLKGSLHQGIHNITLDGYVAFHDAAEYESDLRSQFADHSRYDSLLPRISIHHGMLDTHVPISHSQYVYDTLLNGKATLQVYEDMGHLSLVVEKAKDYACSLAPIRTPCPSMYQKQLPN